MYRVPRLEFVDHVWDLARSGSVVLTGSPGVGKSWTIAQLIRRCKRENRRLISLAAEDFEVNSVDELRQALGFKTDLVSLLRSLASEPLLIIDGLDALRGETSQKAFRDLIQGVNTALPQCSIVVSVRAFDLQQSPELQRLFSNPGNVRSFSTVTTPPFSDDDLRLACDQVPALKSVVAVSGSDEMRELLRNPFNLRLAVELLEAGIGVEDFSSIRSQVQLLQRYWFMRVEAPRDGIDRKALLRQIASEMVKRRSLSIREGDLRPQDMEGALRALRSAEVLRESITDRISFSHNILFDYAVARLLLDEDEFFRFASDPIRTIFFRPSILHFFHHMWWNDRGLFWKVASRCFSDSDLPERAKVVPAVVITESARSLTELAPLFAEASAPARHGLPMTLRAVQALGCLQATGRALWLDLLDKLADQPDLAFINEFIALISIASQSKIRDKEDVQLGSIARRLLKWMWAKAQGLRRHQSEQLRDVAGGRVLPVVIQYYATDPSASREIVESVLNRFGTSDTSSNDAFVLTREMRNIVDHDPSLAVLAYERMFSHPEQSKETTFMGSGSGVLTLTGTRKQDFEAALYGLQQTFPHFLETTPVEAAKAAALAVNVETRREDSLVGGKGRRQRFTFKFLGRPAVYEADFSEIWDRGGTDHLSLQLLNAVLQRLPTSSPSQIRALMRVIRDSAVVAVCWKRLVESASANVRSLYRHVRGLLKIPRFLAAPEVTIAVGNLLKAAYTESVVSDSDKLQIERAIQSISRARFVRRYEKPESIQNRLLLCIGAQRILNPELRNRAEELVSKEQAIANEPYVRITGGSIAYSTEDWLRDEGADVTKPENAEILARIKDVTAFEHRFLNGVPAIEECLAIEPQLRALQRLLEATADARMSQHGRGVLYAAVKSVLKNQEVSKDLPLIEFCRTVVFLGVTDPVPAFDPKYHQSFDMPSWGGPLPRIEAAQGLYHLLWNYGADEDVTSAFGQLARDPVPAVRFQIATGLVGFFKHQDYDHFWQLASEMIDSEPTVGVMVGLVESLGRVAGADPQRAVRELTKLIDRGLPESGRSELARALMQILTGLYVVAQTGAGEQLARFEAEPVRYREQ